MLGKGTKSIRGGICYAIHRYAKANNKYMKSYDKNIESSYLMYLDVKNLYGWEMSQKLSLNGFKWKRYVFKYDENFTKNYNEDGNKGYVLEVDVEYPKNLLNLKSDLTFLPEKKIKKCSKLVFNINDKENYVVRIRTLKQALNHRFVLKKVHRVIQFNQKTWLKPYIDTNTELKTEAKTNFEKGFFKLMNNAAFRKRMENVRKHRDNKLVTTDKKRN